MRCFIGISLETLALSRVIKLQEGVRKNALRGNFTAKTNIHVTLEFLGEVNYEKIEKLRKIIDEVEFSEFKLKISKLTNLKDMVILEIEKSKELLNLQRSLHVKLKENNFKVEDREFYPHITLVRELKTPFNKDLDLESVVNSITLFESTRIDNKLVYKTVYKREINGENL